MQNSQTAPAVAGQEPHNKIFKLAPVEDSRTKVIIETRQGVLHDGDLDFGARCLFVDLLDLALNWYTHRADGVVVISITKLAERLKCSPRTIYDWNKQLVAARYIWMSYQKMPNMWPLNTYHITALDPPGEARQMPTKDGVWGNGARREKCLPGLGVRGTPLHSLQGFQNSNSDISQENAGESGTIVHVSAANSAAPSGRVCTGEPQSLHRGAAKLAAGSGKKQHVGAAENCMGPPQQSAHNKESQDRRIERDLGGEGSPAPKLQGKATRKDAWEIWRDTVADKYPSKREKLRDELLGKLKSAKSSAASFDLAKSQLKPKHADWLNFVDKEIARLAQSSRPEDKVLLADRKSQRQEVVMDPKSYAKLEMVSAAAELVAVLTKKLAIVEEFISGPISLGGA